MKVIPVPCYMDNYAWILCCEERGGAAVIDPSEGFPVLMALEQLDLTLTCIYCTHHHADHIEGIDDLLQNRGRVPVICHEAAKTRIPAATEVVKDGETFNFCGEKGTAIFTPGHTLGSVCFHFGEFLFTGDTLFSAGCGRVFEGDLPMMAASLSKLDSLPDETKIFCGHEYTLKNLEFALSLEPERLETIQRQNEVKKLRERGLPSLPSTLGEERKSNPFLRCSDPALIAVACERYGAESDKPEDVFAAIRRARDDF